MFWKKKKQEVVDIKKCEKVLDELHESLNKNKLNLKELVWTYGQLGYNIGATLEGTGLTAEEVNKQYYLNPRLGIALQAQGLNIQMWIDKIEESRDDKSDRGSTESNGSES